MTESEVDRSQEAWKKYDSILGAQEASVKKWKSSPLICRKEQLHWEESRHNIHAYVQLPGLRILQPFLGGIAPGGHTGKHRHATEAVIYIVEGRGYSTVEWEDGESRRMEWNTGDFLSIPSMAWHQHFNTDPSRRVTYYAVTIDPLLDAMGLKIYQQKEEKVFR